MANAIGAPATAVTLSASPAHAVTGQPVNFTATVAPVPDGGTVEFLANGRPIAGCGAVSLDTTSGQAACQTRFATAGSPRIQAIYSGDPDFAGSASPTTRESVTWSVTQVGSTATAAAGVKLTLSCATLSGGCAVTVAVSASGASLGTQSLNMTPGQTTTVTVALTAQARALPAERKLVQTISLTTSGQRATVTTAKL